MTLLLFANVSNRKCQEEIIKNKAASISGPDLEAEGPNSTIPDDEFFDAVETGFAFITLITFICKFHMT